MPHILERWALDAWFLEVGANGTVQTCFGVWGAGAVSGAGEVATGNAGDGTRGTDGASETGKGAAAGVDESAKPGVGVLVLAAVTSPTAVFHVLTGVTLLASYLHALSIDDVLFASP